MYVGSCGRNAATTGKEVQRCGLLTYDGDLHSVVEFHFPYGRWHSLDLWWIGRLDEDREAGLGGQRKEGHIPPQEYDKAIPYSAAFLHGKLGIPVRYAASTSG